MVHIDNETVVRGVVKNKNLDSALCTARNGTTKFVGVTRIIKPALVVYVHVNMEDFDAWGKRPETRAPIRE